MKCTQFIFIIKPKHMACFIASRREGMVTTKWGEASLIVAVSKIGEEKIHRFPL